MPNKFWCTDLRRDSCTLYPLHIQANSWNGRAQPNSKRWFYYDSETELEAFLPPDAIRKLNWPWYTKIASTLSVSDLDKQGKNDDDEQVVKNANRVVM